MIVQGLWGDKVPAVLEASRAEIEDKIEELISMIDYSGEFNTKHYVFEDELYFGSIQGESFADWLYDYSNPELRDLKKELSIKLNRFITISGGINQFEIPKKQEKTFVVAQYLEGTYYVWTKNDYVKVKRNFLRQSDSKAEFINNMEECFANIYFAETVKPSINTLNNKFGDIKSEIIDHLEKLDDYFAAFQKIRMAVGMDNRRICNAFKEFSGIDCSPQAGRDSVEYLNRTFYNSCHEKEEVLCCELHTKFKKHNRDSAKQDRIYFHPGREGICDGKIIIIHIGTHQ